MTLRIQKLRDSQVVVFTLSGHINAEEVVDLQNLLEVEGQHHRIVLNLEEVTLVDRDAVKFLAQSEAEGIQLKNCPTYIREWIVKE